MGKKKTWKKQSFRYRPKEMWLSIQSTNLFWIGPIGSHFFLLLFSRLQWEWNSQQICSSLPSLHPIILKSCFLRTCKSHGFGGLEKNTSLASYVTKMSVLSGLHVSPIWMLVKNKDTNLISWAWKKFQPKGDWAWPSSWPGFYPVIYRVPISIRMGCPFEAPAMRHPLLWNISLWSFDLWKSLNQEFQYSMADTAVLGSYQSWWKDVNQWIQYQW